MPKIVILGEMLLRLTPPNHLRFSQTEQFDAFLGGAESNVAVSLSNFDFDVDFVTKLPINDIGDLAETDLSKHGVKTQHIIRGGERLGLYYLEKGISVRASNVIYDRKHSSFSTAKYEEFDFDAIFEGADLFYVTGITPALSENTKELTLKAMEHAKRMGVKISFDVNYRKKLWSLDDAEEVCDELLKYADISIGLHGLRPDDIDENGDLRIESAKKILREMKEKYDLEYAISSIREVKSASMNNLSGMIYNGTDFYIGKKYNIEILDRIGGGDAFSAGFLYGILSGMKDSEALEFGIAASAIKHTVQGDYNLVKLSEVESLMQGNSMKVNR